MLLFTLFFLLSLTAAAVSGGASDSLAALPADAVVLLAFKSNADLDSKLLYTTNERFDFCQWRGVKCAQGRVVRYDVHGLGLRGTVPAATLSRLDQLRVLSLRNNSLSGPLPDLSTLVNLKTLFLDHNHFSGEFPPSLLFLHRLLILDLSHNNFTGSLPGNLTLLDRLGYLRLDSNRFSGAIPPLNQSTLALFNISSNNLSGPIPVTPTLKKFKISSFTYNPNLCGEIINKPCRGYPFFNSSAESGDSAAPPSSPTPLLQNAQQGLSDISPPAEKKHHKIVGLVLGLVTGTLIVLAAVLSLVALIRKKREEREEREEEMHAKVESNLGEEDSKAPSFLSLQPDTESSESKKAKPPRVMKSGNLTFCSGEEELYTLEQLMRASAELLGRGTIGTTYKAVMANQLIVSVKRLDACKTAITSGEAFEQHLECVGVLRHPNLVPLRAYFQAKQERLIIFDYHPNGSLFNLIHGMRLFLN